MYMNDLHKIWKKRSLIFKCYRYSARLSTAVQQCQLRAKWLLCSPRFFAFVSSLKLSRQLLCSVRFVFVSIFNLQPSNFIVSIIKCSFTSYLSLVLIWNIDTKQSVNVLRHYKQLWVHKYEYLSQWKKSFWAQKLNWNNACRSIRWLNWRKLVLTYTVVGSGVVPASINTVVLESLLCWSRAVA